MLRYNPDAPLGGAISSRNCLAGKFALRVAAGSVGSGHTLIGVAASTLWTENEITFWMRLSFESKTSAGPVRKINEDSLGFWQPDEEPERLRHGAISVVADGVGGQEKGEVASRMAVDLAIA